ncbi:MAG: hypothetical protein JXB07_00510 [Anaerolineae bacterium]|nr:hypothetical protein [Anaerolineae bacterium]
MDKRIKWVFFIAGGIFALALVVGVLLLSTGTAAAFTAEATPAATPFHRGRQPGSMPFWNGRGGFKGNGFMTGYEENLAEALGITVEELNTAREEAFNVTIEDAVADGRVTQEQADQIQAYRALRGYIDKQALIAETLGISAADLQAALDADQSIKDLMEEAGLDRKTFQEKYQDTYKAAVQQAVDDGVITQEQADQVLSRSGKGMSAWPGGNRPSRGRPGHGYPKDGTGDTEE